MAAPTFPHLKTSGWCPVVLQWLTVGCFLITSCPQANSADDKPSAKLTIQSREVQAAIKRARTFLQTGADDQASLALTGYALLKSGSDLSDKKVAEALADVRKRCGGNRYLPASHHIYSAAVDAMLLEAAGDLNDKPSLNLIADYLIAQQKAHGGWYYPSQNDLYGDTSISQYGVLGLWAAYRAGVTIPTDAWEGAARWHQQTQNADGGSGYHPTATGATETKATMTAAAGGSLQVVRLILFGKTAAGKTRRLNASIGKRFGVLEPVRPEAPLEENPAVAVVRPTRLEMSVLDASIDKNFRALERLAQRGMPADFPCYYLYAIERYAALSGKEEIAGVDWYDAGARWLIQNQATDGWWRDSSGLSPATSLSLLFLGKATESLFKREGAAPGVGGGILVGGRDLAAQLVDKPKDPKTSAELADQALKSLSKSLSDQDVAKAQAAIVAQFQLGNRDDLVGKLDLLQRLVKDPRDEIRRTACWALGKTGELEPVPLLIERLSDENSDVALEASRALCTIASEPAGIAGLAIDPTRHTLRRAERSNGTRYRSPREEWQELSTKAWLEWYLTHRPANMRHDRLEVGPRDRLVVSPN
ncbi:HEAT repeat protein [Planctopirus ephydatiae]|uniref:HEAT repeat protein n=1 Tax=Planctopirus ephydatiae TaxID=2528019 RepID=A0A518GKF1_9PLAN|nr:HEAT repeat domain-containing protein [Planctopirus ephydatiae]QDV29103.1 HEAT repeat protein [Planctopirus ephydatiae]